MSTNELDEEKLRALKELRGRMGELLQPRHDDRFLLRWLRAREYNVDEAEKMLREDFKFRKKFGVDTITVGYKRKEVMIQYKCSENVGFDDYGNAVIFVNFGTCDIKGFVRAMTFYEHLREFIYVFELALKKMEENNRRTGKNGELFTFVVDLTGFRASCWYDRQALKCSIQLLKTCQDHYPERLNVLYILNAPGLFSYVYRLLKACINEVILSKMKLYSTGDDSWKKEIFSFIPKDIIPAYLGGELYAPDRLCSDIVRWNLKIPTSFYLTDTFTLKLSDPGVKEKVIRGRSVFDVEKYVGKAGTLLCWEFETEHHNIRFGLFYRKSEPNDRQQSSSYKDSVLEEILPMEAVESHVSTEKAEWECTKPGTYILRFDNMYSWFRTKYLLYKVEVLLPETSAPIA